MTISGVESIAAWWVAQSAWYRSQKSTKPMGDHEPTADTIEEGGITAQGCRHRAGSGPDDISITLLIAKGTREGAYPRNIVRRILLDGSFVRHYSIRYLSRILSSCGSRQLACSLNEWSRGRLLWRETLLGRLTKRENDSQFIVADL